MNAKADPPWLLGASGPVGQGLLRRLGRDCVPCGRRAPALAGAELARWRIFDLWTSDTMPESRRLISAGPLDACVAWLRRVGPGALRRIVALSSMSAVHKRSSPSAEERVIAQRLQDSEQALLTFTADHGIACTILRPTLIWGMGGDRSLTPFARACARRGWAWIPSGATGLRQPVHCDDVAALCIALVERDAAVTGVFEVGGGERLMVCEMLARTARAVGAQVVWLPLPGFSLTLAARVAQVVGIEAGAIWRSVQDQCCSDDSIWTFAGIQPRGFMPTPSDGFG